MKYKCLIIDDHHLFNDGLSLILKDSGKFEVVGQVYDSREASYSCNFFLPEIVLIDYNMPYLNGIEVVKELKSLIRIPKIVIISMYADKKEINIFQELGVQGFISKTTLGKELISILLDIMQGKFYFERKVETTNIPEDSFAKQNKLTKREVEILKLIQKEYTTQQMAELLNLSYYTVETHRKNINQKLKFETKQELYEFIMKL